MQLHHRKMVLSGTENPEMRVKTFEERLLMPRMHVRKRTLEKLVFTQLLNFSNFSHGQTASLTADRANQALKTFSLPDWRISPRNGSSHKKA